MKDYGHWIDGRDVLSASAQWLDSVDPYRGTAWAKIARGNAADVDRAVRAAHRAMYEGPWSRMTPSERGRILRRIGDLDRFLCVVLGYLVYLCWFLSHPHFG